MSPEGAGGNPNAKVRKSRGLVFGSFFRQSAFASLGLLLLAPASCASGNGAGGTTGRGGTSGAAGSSGVGGSAGSPMCSDALIFGCHEVVQGGASIQLDCSSLVQGTVGGRSVCVAATACDRSTGCLTQVTSCLCSGGAAGAGGATGSGGAGAGGSCDVPAVDGGPASSDGGASLACSTVCNVALCQIPDTGININLGPLDSATCHDRCGVELASLGVTAGCWVLAVPGNGNCYCRDGVIVSGGDAVGGSCTPGGP